MFLPLIKPRGSEHSCQGVIPLNYLITSPRPLRGLQAEVDPRSLFSTSDRPLRETQTPSIRALSASSPLRAGGSRLFPSPQGAGGARLPPLLPAAPPGEGAEGAGGRLPPPAPLLAPHGPAAPRPAELRPLAAPPPDRVPAELRQRAAPRAAAAG